MKCLCLKVYVKNERVVKTVHCLRTHLQNVEALFFEQSREGYVNHEKVFQIESFKEHQLAGRNIEKQLIEVKAVIFLDESVVNLRVDFFEFSKD